MSDALRSAQREVGAKFVADGLPEDYGDPADELRSSRETCVVSDRSDLARLVGTGPDLLGLLNRLSTAKLVGLEVGDGASTVLTTGKGRIVERLFVGSLGEAGLLLVGGPGSGPDVLEHLQRFTFRERTGLRDASDEFALLAIVGPQTSALLQDAGLPDPGPLRCATIPDLEGRAWVLGHDGESSTGRSVLVPADTADTLWRRLLAAARERGGGPAGSTARDARRVLLGLPTSPLELNLDHNPLEAGLLDSISFDKGCYVGQEVVARLRNYDKVSRALLGVRLPAGSPTPRSGDRLMKDGRAVGAVTSALMPPGEDSPVAMAYVKHREAGPGDPVSLENADGATLELVSLPFDR